MLMAMMLQWQGEGRRVTVEAGGGPSIEHA